jgi:hypothetical protein
LPPISSGTSVFNVVVWFAPARHIGAPSFTALP